MNSLNPRLEAGEISRQNLQGLTVGGATPLEQQSRLASYLRALLEHAGEERRPLPSYRHPGVRRARDYLAAHFAEPVTLTDLERVANLSRFHLARSFAARYGGFRFVVDGVPTGHPTFGDMLVSPARNGTGGAEWSSFTVTRRVSVGPGQHVVGTQVAQVSLTGVSTDLACALDERDYSGVRLYVTVR